MPTIDLTLDELRTLVRAHAIGRISHLGDGWYAKDAGYDYDEADATMEAASALITRVLKKALADSEREAETASDARP